MPAIWIVHREPDRRVALARLAGVDAVLGAPGDPLFDSVPPAQVVLLGPSGSFEAELQFAHRVRRRVRNATWILLPEREEAERAEQLFDTLDALVLPYPPDAHRLRRRIRAAAQRLRDGESPLALSQRAAREALVDRFSRWFKDLEFPELLRALDPRLADVPLLVRGEPGTGRGLLARYVHAFGGTAAGSFAHVACEEDTAAEAVLAAIAAASPGERTPTACSIWLEDVERLSAATQRQLRDWIEFSLPPGVLRTSLVRWIASTSDVDDEGALDPGLRRALSGLCIRIPPLRERTPAVMPVANGILLAWCHARGEHPRRIGEDALAVLEEYPWPGNLRELEAVIAQTLAAGSSDPLRADDLRHDGAAFAPLEATSLGALIEEEPGHPMAGEKRDLEAALAALPGQPAPPPRDEPREPAAAEPPEAQVAGNAAPAPSPKPPADSAVRHLADAIAHTVRSPLTTIRSFAGMLPKRYQEEEFRTRFAEFVRRDVDRIENALSLLIRFGSLAPPKREAVDVSALLEELLAERRDAMHTRRLVVLKELDSHQPYAIADPEHLRFALTGLLDRCLELVAPRGHVYLASRHAEQGAPGRAAMRVLLRLRDREPAVASPVEGVSPAEKALEVAIAEAVVRAQGGSLAVDVSERTETVIVLELPAPRRGV